MPLKHRTETFLIVVLTIVIMLTGLLIATLPALPGGLVPWSILFVATLAYPIVLYPLFRADRADYEFRSLHWVPAGMVLLWVLLQFAGMLITPLQLLHSVYTWAWLLPVVSIAVLAILLFCTKVIRQWTKRVFLILLLFVPFATVALWSASGPHLENALAAKLWNNGWGASLLATTTPVVNNIVLNVADTNVEDDNANAIIKDMPNSEPTMIALGMSSDPNEEKWRDYLLEYEESSQNNEVAPAFLEGSSSSASLREPILEPVGDVFNQIDDEDIQNEFLDVFEHEDDDDSDMQLHEDEEVDNGDDRDPNGFLGVFGSNSEDSSSSIITGNTDVLVDSDAPSSAKNVLIGQNSSIPNRLTDSGFGWSFILVSMFAAYCAVLHKRQSRLV